MSDFDGCRSGNRPGVWPLGALRVKGKMVVASGKIEFDHTVKKEHTNILSSHSGAGTT